MSKKKHETDNTILYVWEGILIGYAIAFILCHI